MPTTDEELKAGRKKKQPKDFRLIKRYDVLVVQGKTKLIFPVKDDNVVLYYVPNSDLFDVLQTTHLSIGHGGRDRTIKELDIFTLLGAPTILQSDNGREFLNQIVFNLRNVWPELKIVHGKSRHSQSQGSVERANQDIENMLTT
ncbi:SCAN domain-containing protein 3-like [Acyrthosiphon pisum]|uniref:Integrase catalytic domain-containing protein n=1 Tax=Acyrthosiphon pisum TaxID=7029 RepID=A0A8R2B613_ACYPI|nr:SCAN domain-containing protein 3-like [Acyrthosiphon pisum]|eukprot:XP_008183200.1 PREDICTED: SCAN domain-containing protein 3-like [Acyrthosiphon pisum]